MKRSVLDVDVRMAGCRLLFAPTSARSSLDFVSRRGRGERRRAGSLFGLRNQNDASLFLGGYKFPPLPFSHDVTPGMLLNLGGNRVLRAREGRGGMNLRKPPARKMNSCEMSGCLRFKVATIS